MRRLARRIKSINATPFPDNGYNTFNTTSSTTTCRLLTFQIEGNPVVAATPNGTKWHQNCRWTLSLAGISSALVQRCEVTIVKTRKTTGSLIQAIDGPQELDNSLLTDSTNKSNFKILKQYNFMLGPDQGKMLTGFFKTPPRQTEDWRDATDVANYIPRGSVAVIFRHSNANNARQFGSSINGHFHVARHTYMTPYN